MPDYSSWKSDAEGFPQLSPKSSPLTLYKGPEHIVKGDPSEMHEAFKTLEDGRIYFAVDTKKIYLDCDFETSDGDRVQDRLSFGGNNGIFYGRKTFTEAQIENKEFWFVFENGDLEANRDDVPAVDDLILNSDGCFYRVTNVVIGPIDETVIDADGNTTIVPSEEMYTIIETKKLTIAGSGSGGGGGSTSSVITVTKDPDQANMAIKSKRSIPIGFKVLDSIEDATIDVNVYINSSYVGTRSYKPSAEIQYIDLYRWVDYFNVNQGNTIMLQFKDEYDTTQAFTIRNFILIELKVEIESTNLGQKIVDSFPVRFYPYGGSSMYKWWVNVNLHPQGEGNGRITKMENLTQDKGAEAVYTANLVGFNEGSYLIDFQIEAQVDADDPTIISSAVASTAFYYSESGSTALGISMSMASNSEHNQYGTAIVEYTVAYSGSAKSTVHLRAVCEGTDIVNTFSEVDNGIPQRWSIPLSLAGVYTFYIGVDDFMYETKIENFEVDAASEDVPYINTDDDALQLYFSATGKSNSQADKDVWTWGTGRKKVTADFKGFNWQTSGWKTDDNNQTSLHLSNGAKLTIPFALFSDTNTGGLGGAEYTGKTVELDFKVSNVRDPNAILISAASWDDDGSLYCGIVGQGEKICMNLSNVKNYHTPEVEEAMDINEIAATNGLRAYITDDERIHVSFVVQSKTEAGTKRLVYTYLNGVISGLYTYDDESALRDISDDHPSYLIFDSTAGDIDLYGVRVYSKKLTDDEILYNYAADQITNEQRSLVRAMNNALDSEGNISLNRVAELKNIPYIVFTDCRQTSNKKGGYNKKDDTTWGANITDQNPSLPTGKKDFRWCEFYYVDPNHPERNIGDINHKVTGVIYAQGTSSLDYPTKNIRLRIRETNGNAAKQSAYSLLPAVPIPNLNSTNQELAAEAAREQAKWENIPAVRLFTFKADYMDSSMSHNTGTGNVLAALYDSVNLKTPAQEYWPDKTLLTNVVGVPVLGFYQPYGSTTAEYIGRYNFDLDKAEHDLFGFNPYYVLEELPEGSTAKPKVTESFGVLRNGDYLQTGFQATLDEEYDDSKTYYTKPNDSAVWTGSSDEDFQAYVNKKTGTGPLYEKVDGPYTIQCWEFLDNGAALCGFRQTFNEDTDDLGIWTAAFESRFPEHVTERASDKRGFIRFVNWVASTNQATATNATLDAPVTYGTTTYTEDTAAYRLAKFRAEISNYMRLDYTLFYYVLTEALVMIDSRAKNMMMCSFDVDTVHDTGHWFPIFYDMDTILGLTNRGVLRFRYDTDDATENGVYNASANYGSYDSQGNWLINGKVSVLWANLREAFSSEIAEMYNRLRTANKFTYDYLSTSYNDAEADAYQEIYDNKDAKYKYIDPYGKTVIIDGKPSDIIANYLHAAQGTRSLHREYFLKHRFAYLDSKYPSYSVGSHDIAFRLYDMDGKRNVPGLTKEAGQPAMYADGHSNQQFRLTSSSTQYGVAKVGNGSNVPPVKLEINVPTYTSLPIGLDTLNEKEAYLFNLGDVYDIGDLSDKFPVAIDIMKPLKLRKLTIGNPDPAYVSDIQCKVSGWNNLPLLEELDLRNAQMDVSGEVDLSKCFYFKRLLAKGSNLTKITLPVGGDIERLEFPAGMTGLSLRDNVFFNTFDDPTALSFEGYSAMNSLTIENCPRIDSRLIIEGLRSAGRRLTIIRMPDINWTIPATEDWCTFDSQGHITDVKICDYLTTIPQGRAADGSTIARQRTDNHYVSGTVTIQNGQNIGIDTLSISRKYAQLFPGLKFVYEDNEHNISGYHLNIRTLSGGIVSSTSDYMNSTVLSADEITGDNDEVTHFDFVQHMNLRVAVPTQVADNECTYEFKGWSYSAAYADKDEALVTQHIDIPVTVITDEDGYSTMSVEGLESNYLTLKDFGDDLELNLYPVFLKHYRIIDVWFYMREKDAPAGVQYLNPEYHQLVDGEYQPFHVTYGTAVVPPTNEPTVIVLDPNDKTAATIQIMNHYEDQDGQLPSASLKTSLNQISYYPVFNTPVRMNEVTGAKESYFSATILNDYTYNSQLGLATEGKCIEATIRSTFTGEAVVVPLTMTINNEKYKVVSLKNACPTIKRIFFEADPETQSSNLLYIEGGVNAGFALTTGTSDKGTPNETLEFVDFGACKQLKVIGGDVNGAGLTGEFSLCPNLYIPELPDSLMWIGGNVFRAYQDNDKVYQTNVCFTKLPADLTYIGQYAFRGCIGLTNIDATGHNPDLEWFEATIGPYAFQLCSNLNFTITRANETNSAYYFDNWMHIENNAFDSCTNLVAFNSDVAPDYYCHLVDIGQSAFYKCSNLSLGDLPTSLVSIAKRGFDLGGSTDSIPIHLASIENTLMAIGEEAFRGCVVNNQNGNAFTWRLDNNTNPTIHVNAFSGLTLQTLRFANWDSTSAVYADYDADRTPVWQFAKVEPWYTGDTFNIPFGAKQASGDPTPYVIDANN